MLSTLYLDDHLYFHTLSGTHDATLPVVLCLNPVPVSLAAAPKIELLKDKEPVPFT